MRIEKKVKYFFEIKEQQQKQFYKLQIYNNYNYEKWNTQKLPDI